MNKTLEKVVDYIRKAIKEHPIQDEGKTFEPTINYMNGNDGTKFDWVCNGRTCEFFVFYATESQLGYVKAYVTKEGFIEGYVWDTERYSEGVRLERVALADDDEEDEHRNWLSDLTFKERRAKAFYDWLIGKRDSQNVWDKPIATL